jgi:DNA processing protein
MALLADATVIIEATATSGALGQGWEALRLGRALFLAKSLAEDPRLLWPTKMLYYGAQVLADATLDRLFDVLPPRIEVVGRGTIPF